MSFITYVTVVHFCLFVVVFLLVQKAATQGLWKGRTDFVFTYNCNKIIHEMWLKKFTSAGVSHLVVCSGEISVICIGATSSCVIHQDVVLILDEWTHHLYIHGFDKEGWLLLMFLFSMNLSMEKYTTSL